MSRHLARSLTQAEGARWLWGGLTPPSPYWTSSNDIFNPTGDYRNTSDKHESFDVVDITSVDLAEHQAWPVILDEALRLLRPQGVLTLRSSNSRFVSSFEIMRRVWTWNSGRVLLLGHETAEGGSHQLSLRLTHDLPRYPTLSSMDFVVITDGSDIARIDRFIASARQAATDGGIAYKILIASSFAVDTTRLIAYQGDCELLVVPEAFPGWITRRKNQAVARCGAENILIVHDRYWVRHDFVKLVREYGPDYSVLICRQITANGERFPDLVTTSSETVTTSSGLLEYGQWGPYVYVNGGAILAKKEILEACPWNELLLWGEFEDVEWTRRLRNSGLEPRFARLPTLFTEAPRENYADAFEPVSAHHSHYIVPGDRAQSQTLTTPATCWGRLHSLVGIDAGEVALRSGISFGGGWKIGADGARLPPGQEGIIFFRPPVRVRKGFVSMLFGGVSSGSCWKVGSVPLSGSVLLGGWGRIIIPANVVRDDGAIRIVVTSSKEMHLNGIRIFHRVAISETRWMRPLCRFAARLFRAANPSAPG